jgi:hypothetical protein
MPNGIVLVWFCYLRTVTFYYVRTGVESVYSTNIYKSHKCLRFDRSVIHLGCSTLHPFIKLIELTPVSEIFQLR